MFKNLSSPKFLVSIALIVGLVLGYLISDTLSSPKIKELNEKTLQLEELQEDYTKFQNEFGVLAENYTSLSDDYLDLIASTVPKSDYDSLLDENIELSEETEAMSDELNSLQDELMDTVYAKDQLQTEYTKLLNNYNEIKVLSWTFFIVDELEVNLTTVKNNYNPNEDISGNIRINYLNNEPFDGSFSLLIWSDFYETGTPSEIFQVYGTTDYTFTDPFVKGPGNYHLRIREIKDSQGNVIVGYSELLNYKIPVEMS
jgi:uncharacterized membrane-anchored protein YhcB (DUF1043 family)